LTNNLAILDLGTNTFQLLIVEIAKASYKTIHKEKKFVKLGKFGLDKFNEAVINRAIEVIIQYEKIVNQYQVSDALIFGTAGLRMAKNAQTLISEIESITSYKVKQ